MLFRRFLLAAASLALAGPLAGCALNPDGSIDWGGSVTQASSRINAANIAVAKYAPIVGKDLLMVGNILVQAECSPAMGLASQTASNILKITAPSSSSAAQVQDILATNQAVAAQLCPLVSAIQAAVGAVPKGAPSQTIPAPATAATVAVAAQ
jgi:hypothetical protein